jgi:GTPase SAR1 family protein
MNTVGFDSAKQKSETVTSALRDIAALVGEPQNAPVHLETGGAVIPGVGLTSDAATLATRAEDIRQGIFKVIVLGEFKNGKSTLLNSMLGNKTLPAKAAPATAIITLLVHGDSKDVAVYETGKEKPRILSWDIFRQEFQLTKDDQETLSQGKSVDRFQHIEYAKLECQHPICTNGVKLIDSPGLKEHVSRTRVTLNYLKQSQAVIFVLNAQQILSEDEREFIETVFGSGRLNQVFFIINKINLLDSQEDVDDIKSWVESALKHHFLDDSGVFDQAFYKRRVFFVNAKGALDARTAIPVNNTMLEASGIPPLEKELEQFLTSDEKVAAALESTIQVLSYVVPEARRKILKKKITLDEPLTELESRRAESEIQLKNLEGQKEDIQGTILVFGDVIKQKIYANLRDYITEMHETWPQDSKNLKIDISVFDIGDAIFRKVAKERIATKIEGEVQKYCEMKFKQWSERIPTVIQEDTRKMMIKIEAQVHEFQLKLAEIENLFTGGKSGNVIDFDKNKTQKLIQLVLGFGDLSQMAETAMGAGEWGGFFSRMLQSLLIMLGLSIIIPGGAIFWAVVIALDLIIIHRGQSKFKEKLLATIGEKLYEGLQKEIPTKQEEIFQSVDTQFAKVAKDLTEKLQAQIDEMDADQNRIIDQKTDASFSANQEKDRLDTIANKLIELFNVVYEAAFGKRLTPEEIDQLGGGKSALMSSDRA